MIEVTITLAIVLLVLVIVLQCVTEVEQSWRTYSADPFSPASSAFDAMARHLAGATLEPYQDYANLSGDFRTNAAPGFVPDHLARRSDLDFVCGPSAGATGLLTASGRITAGCGVFFLEPAGYSQTEANTGMASLLNAMGYFVEFGDDSSTPAYLPLASHRWRWRLKQVEQASESLQVFSLTSSSAWIQPLVAPGASLSLAAENVIALIVLPERAANDSGTPLAQNFAYDSRDAGNPLTRHQLPPRLRLALMAIDEPSAQILAARNGTAPPRLIPNGLFQQSVQLDADLGTLGNALTAQKINHRLFQRTILLPAAAWSNTLSQ